MNETLNGGGSNTLRHEDLPTHWILSGMSDPIIFPDNDLGQQRIESLLRDMSVSEIILGRIAASDLVQVSSEGIPQHSE